MDLNDEQVAERLTQLAKATSLAEACEVVAHELQGWELQQSGWAQSKPDVPVYRIYQIAATLARTEVERQRLQLEALFIERSAEVKAATLKQEARRRSENGKAGGAKKSVSDAQLVELVRAWDRAHPRSRRGLVTFVSGRAGLSREQTGKRLKNLLSSEM